MQVMIGFAVALILGLTGVGGGSLATPALVLLAGIPAADAVGTALVFTTAVRLLATPFYLSGRQVHFRCLGRMLLGAVPGLLGGTFLLRGANARLSKPAVLLAIGSVLIFCSILTSLRNNDSLKRRASDRPASWLGWMALPIGIETGFSAAGAGALGTLLLLNFSGLSAAEAVGTDLVFGTVVAGLGAIFHFSFGTISGAMLKNLLLGGIPGVIVGCVLARWMTPNILRRAIVVFSGVLGLELLVAGARSLL